MMLTIPSIWSLAISTIMFFVSAWYFRRYLDAQKIPRGMTRGIVIFVLAFFVSWGAGEIADWTRERVDGPQIAVQDSLNLSQLLKVPGQPQL